MENSPSQGPGLSTAKLGRGLHDVSDIFRTKYSPSGKIRRFVIVDMFDPETKIPNSLLNDLNRHNLDSFYIYGSVSRYKLYGVDKVGVPYHVIVKDGTVSSITYGNRVIVMDPVKLANPVYRESVQFLFLNVSMTFKRLKSIIFAPDNKQVYKADCILSIIHINQTGRLLDYIRNFDRYNYLIPSGILMVTDQGRQASRHVFEDRLKTIPITGREVYFLGIIDEKSLVIDADFSILFN